MIARMWHFIVRIGVVSYLWLLRPRKRRIRGLIISAESVLLVKHVGGKDQWTLPGGGAHANEKPFETLKREIHEELKIDVELQRDLGLIEVNRYGALTTYHILESTTDNKDIKPDRWELRDAQWFSINQLPDDCSQAVKTALERHYNQTSSK